MALWSVAEPAGIEALAARTHELLLVSDLPQFKRSLAALGGPLAALAPDFSFAVLQQAEWISLCAGESLIEQYHRADYFYLLLEGEVDFHISLESLARDFDVGWTNSPWTPIGWSAFREPFRYGTSVRARSDVVALRLRVSELSHLFERRPKDGQLFLENIHSLARALLSDARRRLIEQLDEPVPLSEPSERKRRTSYPVSESMVTNAAPNPRDILARSAFFEVFPDDALDALSRAAQTEYFFRGAELQQQDCTVPHLTLLADGRVRTEFRDARGRSFVLGLHSDAGEVLGGGLLAPEEKAEIALRATRDGSVLRISRSSLQTLFEQRPSLGILFQKRMLWLLSTRLRALRARIVSEEFEQDVLAVENLIEQARTELAVTSPLHKLPHLLKSTVTLSDALNVVDAARASNSQIERHVGKLAHELLQAVRREQRFFASLQAAFQEVVSAPEEHSKERIRRMNAENFIRVFSQVPHRILGLEHLPPMPGHIFVFNHLKNHEYNTLPNGFQLTLDSHFIASMILHRAYRDPGVRVVRQSRAEEYGHQAYYERLGHVSVYTRESDIPHRSRSARFAEFVATASAHLRRGTNLVLAPEGTSYSTEESPGAFKAGAFRLAGSIRPEPLIVPIAVAHFDRRLNHTTLCAVVHEPFKITDHVADVDDASLMQRFLKDFQGQFACWVRDAAALGQPGPYSPESAAVRRVDAH